jgi:hypothetical protein
MNVEEKMEQYVQVREILRAEGKVWKEREAFLKNILDRLEGQFGEFMKSTKQENLTAKSGTAYTSEVWYATVADADLLRNHVKDTGQMELLKLAANPTAVRAYVEANKCLPPGVSLTSVINVNVRKS